jgi:hypothetical protein
MRHRSREYEGLERFAAMNLASQDIVTNSLSLPSKTVMTVAGGNGV